MLDENLSVSHLIDSNFTFLNSRLARFYDIDGIQGDDLQRVSPGAAAPPRRPAHAGGRFEGDRQRLEHFARRARRVGVGAIAGRADSAAARQRAGDRARYSRRENDPRNAGQAPRRRFVRRVPREDRSAGFRAGKLRPRRPLARSYVQLIAGRREQGATIDASYSLPDGREFRDIQEFRSLIASQPRKLARNVAEKLLVYGTGANISFADRQAIDQIVDRAAQDNYGFRSIVHAVTTSPTFLSK